MVLIFSSGNTFDPCIHDQIKEVTINYILIDQDSKVAWGIHIRRDILCFLGSPAESRGCTGRISWQA